MLTLRHLVLLYGTHSQMSSVLKCTVVSYMSYASWSISQPVSLKAAKGVLYHPHILFCPLPPLLPTSGRSAFLYTVYRSCVS